MCGRLCISQEVCLLREPHLIAFSGPPSQAVMSQKGGGGGTVKNIKNKGTKEEGRMSENEGTIQEAAA